MYIKPLLIIAVSMLALACQHQTKDSHINASNEKEEAPLDLPDSLSARRISFVLDLKQSVAENVWPGFDSKTNEGTLIYFDSVYSEVFFPDNKLLKKLHSYKKHNDNYWLTDRIDSIPFHMEVMISFSEDDSAECFYKNPVEQYSSVEEVGRYIPSVESTEMWTTMVIHEMFHHFQYNNEKFVKYAESQIGMLPFDPRNMVALCQQDKEFLNMIQNENKILMLAISERNNGSRDSLISLYLNQREKRIARYEKEYPHLEQVENYYIIQEGSARYIEYHSMFVLKNYFNNASAPSIQNDPKFNSYSEFEKIDLDNDTFNYLVYAGPTDYHYTLGFNMMRLLDELKMEYKNYLLNKPDKGLHQYLEDYINSLPNIN